MSKYYYNKDYFKVIDTPNKAYWLGFLYADGCINSSYHGAKLDSMTFEMTLCREDEQHLYKFAKCLETNVPIKQKINKFKGKEYLSSRITICCTKMCYDLCAKGCTPQKTYNIKFPNNEIVSDDLMKDFIRGFFDGDGCICVRSNNRIQLVITGMSNMLEDIANYLISKQVIRKVPKIHNDKRSKCSAMFFYGADNVKDILDYLYSGAEMYLDRKYNKYKDYYKDYKPLSKRGVYWDKYSKKYIATIYINGKREFLGRTNDLDEAIRMRKDAEIRKMNNLK